MRLFAGFLCLGLAIIISQKSFSQSTSINSSGALPHPSAMLDVESTDKGVLIPRTDTSAVNSSGTGLANGLLIFQSTDAKFYYYDGAKWIGIDGPDTDDQTIDAFGLSGNTLSLSLEDDGQATQTVDLSSVNTDDQTIDTFSLSGTTLSLALESDGQSPQTVDLSSVNTDDQEVDLFNLSGTTLSLALENDGQPTHTVNLAAVNTDNQEVDIFNLSGTTLSLALEDDGQPTHTVNLAAVNTDNQEVDLFNLSGTTLSLALEDDGQPTHTVNLSSINTDDQTIDAIGLSGSTFSISLENDGEPAQTVDFTALLPVGSIIMYAGSSAPTNWLICNGSTFSTSTYPALNSVLGGNTLPNFSGRFPVGVGNSGTSGSTNHSLGSTGGEEKHTLTTSEMPSHTHNSGTLKMEEQMLSRTNDGTGNQAARDGSDDKLYDYNDITGNTGSTGGGGAHNNMPPFRTVNFIIKAR